MKEAMYAIYGEKPRDHLRESKRALKRHVQDVKIIVYSNLPLESKYADEVKIFHTVVPANTPANSSTEVIRFQCLLEAKTRDCCYLDNDIYVVSKWFNQGFDIARRFGMAMVINPRLCIMTPHGNGDVDLGWKYDEKICPELMARDKKLIGEVPMMWTALNNGVIFMDTENKQARRFCELVLSELATGFSRGQTATVRAILKSDYHPYVLTPHWCADNPMQGMIAMHVGGKYHKHMLDYYNEYLRA